MSKICHQQSFLIAFIERKYGIVWLVFIICHQNLCRIFYSVRIADTLVHGLCDAIIDDARSAGKSGRLGRFTPFGNFDCHAVSGSASSKLSCGTERRWPSKTSLNWLTERRPKPLRRSVRR